MAEVRNHRMFEQLLEFITEKYSRAGKIIEVGVGHRIDVAQRLRKKLPQTEIIVTDKDENWPRKHSTDTVKAVADDVTNPHIPIYRDASLIYSLHSPIELVPHLEDLSDKVKSDLLIVPISDEEGDFARQDWKKITRQGRTVGWLRSPRKRSQI
jgi:uncharacterized UPF0146 family protein